SGDSGNHAEEKVLCLIGEAGDFACQLPSQNLLGSPGMTLDPDNDRRRGLVLGWGRKDPQSKIESWPNFRMTTNDDQTIRGLPILDLLGAGELDAEKFL
ncbi:MAG: hypothetical protein VB855_13765, partial [Pirellulaceae bacterium]